MPVKFTLPRGFESSPMEKIIENMLRERGIKYFREVQFEGCINPKTGMQLRYDFYIKEKNLIIEYDGKNTHTSEDVKFRDGIKNKFAKQHKIKLVRVQNGIAGINTFFKIYFNYKKVDVTNESTLAQNNKVKPPKIKNKVIKEVLNRRASYDESEEQKRFDEVTKVRDLLSNKYPVIIFMEDFKLLSKYKGTLLLKLRKRLQIERRILIKAKIRNVPIIPYR